MKILSVLGTRPEAIKMAPVILAMQAHKEIDAILAVSGQHRDLLDAPLQLFKLQPDFDFAIMKKAQSINHIVTQTISNMDPVLKQIKPDLVFVHGDTSTSLGAAIASFNAGYKVGHVEAGLRSGTLTQPFPEEGNRRLIDQISTLAFAPTKVNSAALTREGFPKDQIIETGNTVIDAIMMIHNLLQESGKGAELNTLFNLGEEERKLILTTTHRRENHGQRMIDICNAILVLAKRDDVRIIFPVHPNPKVQDIAKSLLGDQPNISLIKPQGYLEFVYLLEKAHIVLTDSGGIQEEAPSLGTPTLVLRDVTERQEAIDAGTVKLVGSNQKQIVETATYLLDNDEAHNAMAKKKNPYGDGKASARIIDASLNWYSQFSQTGS